MASISEQTTDPARARYKVRWREADGSARSESFTTEKAAKRRKRELENAADEGTHVDDRSGRITLRSWAEETVPSWVDLAPRTQDRYASDLATHILPALGDRALRDVTSDDVQKFVAKLNRTLAPETVRKVYYQLSRLFADAVQPGRRIKSSPCLGIKLPKIRKAAPTTLDRVEVDKLADQVDDLYRAWVYVCGVAGLRIGEALALRWSDVKLDADRPSLIVRGTKTDAAVRGVPLPRVVVDELRDLREWTDPAPRSLVFPAARGGAYAPGNFRRRVFDPAVDVLGLDVTPHALRHSAITAWLEAGATPMLAAAWAGHSDGGALIVRRYGHVRPSHADQVLDALGG